MRLFLLYLFLLYAYFCQSQSSWNYPLTQGGAGIDSFIHQQDSLVIYSGRDSFKVIDNKIDSVRFINEYLYTFYNDGFIDTNYIPIGDSTCVFELTRNEIVTLRNTNQLVQGCYYKATDITWITAGGPGTFTSLATGTNSISSQGHYEGSFNAGQPFNAIINWNTGRIHYIYDVIRENEIIGDVTVQSFPFGTTNIEDNYISYSTVTYGTGQFSKNIIINSTVNKIGSASFYANTIEGLSDVTIGNNGFTYNYVGSQSSINTTGSSGNILRSRFERANCGSMQNITTINIYDSKVSEYGRITANDASVLYLNQQTISNNAYIQVNTGLTHYSYGGKISGQNTRILQTDGAFYNYYSDIKSTAYVEHNSTGANYLYYGDLGGGARVQYSTGATNNRVYYPNLNSYGYLYFYNNSQNCNSYYSTLLSYGRQYINNCFNGRYYYNSADSYGYLLFQKNTAIHYAYYAKASSSAQVQMIGNGTNARLYAVTAESQGIIRLQNSPNNGRLYYSSTTAYFYMYITITANATVQGLHGYGRSTQSRTYNAGFTAPATFNF